MALRGGRGRRRAARRLVRRICTWLRRRGQFEAGYGCRRGDLTVESECNEFEAHVAEPDVEPCRCSAWTDTCDVEGAGHERLLILGRAILRLSLLMGIKCTDRTRPKTWEKP